MSLTIDFQTIGSYASNTDSSALSPGAPSGVVSGNLLIAATGNRSIGQTIPTPTGWTLISLTGKKLRVYGRIATGGGDDTPTFDWSGSNDSFAVLLRYDGDVPAVIGNLVPSGGVTEDSGTAGGNDVPLESTTAPSGTDMLVFGFPLKNKTSNSNGAVISTTPEFTLRGELAQADTALLTGVGDWQQAGAGANYDGDSWSHDQGADALAFANTLIYFQPRGGVASRAVHHQQQMNG